MARHDSHDASPTQPPHHGKQSDFPDAIETRLRSLEQTIARIDGDMASSWALHTRPEYEKEFRASVKHDLREFATKFLAGAIAVLAGIGLGLMYYTVNRVFDDKNKAAIETLQARLETSFNKQLEANANEREWQRFQNNGTDRKRLAEFYKELDDQKNSKFMQKKRELIAKAFLRFKEAIEIDPKQATSHYELGELNYSFPLFLDLKDLVNEAEAIRHYEAAVNLYSQMERERGWKGDCYLNLGRIYDGWASARSPYQRYNLDMAKTYLENASKEYNDFGPRKRQDIRDNLDEIAQRLKSLQERQTL